LRGQDTESGQQNCENDTNKFHFKVSSNNPNFSYDIT
jgi:hypothetical protein